MARVGPPPFFPMYYVRLFLRVVDGMCRWAAYASAGLLAALFALGFVEILSRKLLNYSIPFALEYSQYMLAILMFGGSAWALREGGHIRVTLLLQVLSPRMRRIVDFAATSFGFAISAFLAQAFVRFTIVTYQRGSLSYFPSETPLAWPQTAMAVGISLISLALAARLIRLLIGEAPESVEAGESLENLVAADVLLEGVAPGLASGMAPGLANDDGTAVPGPGPAAP